MMTLSHPPGTQSHRISLPPKRTPPTLVTISNEPCSTTKQAAKQETSLTGHKLKLLQTERERKKESVVFQVKTIHHDDESIEQHSAAPLGCNDQVMDEDDLLCCLLRLLQQRRQQEQQQRHSRLRPFFPTLDGCFEIPNKVTTNNSPAVFAGLW